MTIDEISPLPPALSFSLEPQESGKLVYLQVAPVHNDEPRTGAINFRMRITNNRKTTVVLKRITVSFPGSKEPARSFDRNWSLAAGGTKDQYLDESETIKVPHPAPASIRIDLEFDGLAPLTQSMGLAPHRSPTPTGSYLFPLRVADLRPDEYPYLNNHGTGEQNFAYDIKAIGWNTEAQDFDTYQGLASDTNDARFAWHKGVHAMADGVVLHRESGYPDNPRPAENKLLQLKHASGGVATDVAVAHLEKLEDSNVSNARMLTAVRTDRHTLKLIVFEQTEDAKVVTRIGEAEGGAIPDQLNSEVSLTVLSKNRAVTAVTSGVTLTLTLWSISDDAKTLTIVDTVVVPVVTAAKVACLSATSIVVAMRKATGKLAFGVWTISNSPNSLQPTPMGQVVTAEPASLIDLAVLSKTRVVTTAGTGSNLKLVVWDFDHKAGTLSRRGDTGSLAPGNAAAISATLVSNQVAATIRTDAGKIVVVFWNIDGTGKPVEIARTNGLDSDACTKVTMCLFKKGTLLSAIRLQSGVLRMLLWGLKGEGTDKKPYFVKRQGELDANLEIGGPLALANIETTQPTAATAVTDTAGNLKVILWQVARLNRYVILHGDATRGYEAVLYAHMSDMSKLAQPLLEPGDLVKEGQLLGLLGNSGASGEPHLHIGALKIHAGKAGLSKADLLELIDDVRTGAFNKGPNDAPYRPIPFHHAHARQFKGLQRGGVVKNKFSLMSGDGIYGVGSVVFPSLATELPLDCKGIKARLAGLKLEVAGLQADLHTASPTQKPPIVNEIRKLKLEREALEELALTMNCSI